MDKLAADSAAALAAGMSYGKYMALKHKPVQRKPEPKKPEGDRVCKVCGAWFFAKVYNQMTCSHQCSVENNRLRANERARQLYAERMAKCGKQVR